MAVPSEVIREHARTLVRSVLQDEAGLARMVKKMVGHTISEYRGRFLHELIQNGYDAHPDGEIAGRIAIHFDETEDDHGVLYVANGGDPLSQRNFERMSSLGDSDKSIGAGVGNKGVGFKSVFQVCLVPEVYSASGPNDLGFGGFSFRFGTFDDLLKHVEGNEQLARQIAEDLSLSLLTVPLEDVPESVLALRAEGYVTVLRLPARSARAGELIVESIEALLGAPSPVMLFLERLEQLSVRRDAASQPTILRRKPGPSQGRDGGSPDASPHADAPCTVVLDDAESFRLFKARVPPDLLRAALEESVEQGALDERWLEWDADAWVSVAVGDGSVVEGGTAYTYLPMGEGARSPLAGHINAPFVTNFARVDLDHEQPVNRLMLSQIAELCIRASDAIAAVDGDAETVVDLLAWDEHLHTLAAACDRAHSAPLIEWFRLPDGRGTWTPLSRLHLWPSSDTGVIDSASVSAHTSAALLDTSRVDEDRAALVLALAENLDVVIEPSEFELAGWIEELAVAMLGRDEPTETWSRFYDDLPLLFRDGGALQGREILLAVDGSLVPCNEPAETERDGSRRRRRSRSVFFQPRTTAERGEAADDEDPDDDALAAISSNSSDGEYVPDFRPPRTLRGRLTLMHPDLAWRDGPLRTPGREFLESRHLVQPFRTAGLLALLGRVMNTVTSDGAKRDALEYAFRLFAREPERHARELAAVGLHVPTQADAWIEATSARFGSPWTVMGAKDLAAVAAAATDDTPELMALAERLVADPEVFMGTGSADGPPERPGSEAAASQASVEDVQAATRRWERFLQTIGVTTTLPVLSAPDNRELVGRSLRADTIAGWKVPSGVPGDVVTQWRAGLPEIGYTDRPETVFHTSDHTHWLSGQSEVGQLPKRDRAGYARCVVRTLQTLRPEQWRTTWRRKSRGGYEWVLPTPLAAFVREAAWVPVSRAGDNVDLRSANESWYVRPGEEMAANYSPLVEPSLRRVLESAARGGRAIDEIGLRVWGSRKDAAALINHLTALFDSHELSDAGAEHLRDSLARAWGEVGDPAFTERPLVEQGLVVDRSGRMEILAPETAGQERVFVVESGDRSTTARLIRDIGWPVVAVGTDEVERLREVAASVISAAWHDDVVVADDWELEVLVDGSRWVPSRGGTRLVEEVPWLPLVIACTMRYPRSGGSGVGRNLERHLDILDTIQVVRCTEVAIETAAGEQPLPVRLRGVLAVPGPQPTLLVERMQEPFTWAELGTVAEAALELIGQPRYLADLALTISRMTDDPAKTVHEPEVAEIADIIDQPLVRVLETEGRVYGSVAGLVLRILPTAVHLWGPEAIERLDHEAVSTRDEVHSALASLGSGDAALVAMLLEQGARSLDGNSVRRAMGVSLAAYNATLREHFPSAQLVDNSASHLEVFALRRTQRRGAVVDWMRAARLPTFEAGQVQDDWPELRELSFLLPDPDWGTTVDDLSNAVIDRHIDSLMSSMFGPKPTEVSLEPWSEVRQQNGPELRRRLESVEKLARAWHRKHAGADAGRRPDDGSGPDAEFVSSSMRRLDASGALDFVVLDSPLLLEWLDRLDLWPAPMPLSATSADLGLSENDLEEASSEQDAAKAAKIRAERQLTIYDEVIEVDLSFENVVERVADFLAGEPASLNTRFMTTSLQTLASEKSRRGRGGATRDSQPTERRKRMSDVQRDAIGLTGEMIAFYWLRNKERSPVDETCWKSSYVSFAFPGTLGDDGLGYDFAVPRAEGQVLYEVKATTSEHAGMIELGESEVATAQEFARGKKRDRWRLLVVEYVLSTEPRILMLPNPFNPQSRGLYRFVGNGVRLRFSQ